MIVKIMRRFLSRGGRETFCHHLSGGGCGRQACRVMPHDINGMLVMVLPLLLWVDCLTVVVCPHGIKIKCYDGWVRGSSSTAMYRSA